MDEQKEKHTYRQASTTLTHIFTYTLTQDDDDDDDDLKEEEAAAAMLVV